MEKASIGWIFGGMDLSMGVITVLKVFVLVVFGLSLRCLCI